MYKNCTNIFRASNSIKREIRHILLHVSGKSHQNFVHQHLKIDILSNIQLKINLKNLLIIGICKHGNDRDEYCLNGMHRQPPFTGFFVAPSVVSGLVQNGNTNIAIFLDVWVPNISDHLELGRSEWIFFGKDEMTFEKPAFVKSVAWTNNQHFPLENIIFIDQTGAEPFHWVLIQFCQLFAQ